MIKQTVVSQSLRPGLTVVIPAFNEGQSIKAVVEDVKKELLQDANAFTKQVIVVDDGSSDNTAQQADLAGAYVVRHIHNRGYGAALKTGIRHATTEFVVTMDSDQQHRARDVARLWVHAPSHDMVVGQRTQLVHSPLWRMPGKWLLGRMANYLSKRRIPDLNSGLRIMRTRVVRKYVHLCPSGFSFSTTITLAMLCRGYSVVYHPIEIRKRVGKSSVTMRTGLDTIVTVLRIIGLFNPLRIFIPASLFMVLFGVCLSLPYALLGRGVSVGSVLAIMSGVILFGVGLVCDQISQLRLERFDSDDNQDEVFETEVDDQAVKVVPHPRAEGMK